MVHGAVEVLLEGVESWGLPADCYAALRFEGDHEGPSSAVPCGATGPGATCLGAVAAGARYFVEVFQQVGVIELGRLEPGLLKEAAVPFPGFGQIKLKVSTLSASTVSSQEDVSSGGKRLSLSEMRNLQSNALSDPLRMTTSGGLVSTTWPSQGMAKDRRPTLGELDFSGPSIQPIRPPPLSRRQTVALGSLSRHRSNTPDGVREGGGGHWYDRAFETVDSERGHFQAGKVVRNDWERENKSEAARASEPTADIDALHPLPQPPASLERAVSMRETVPEHPPKHPSKSREYKVVNLENANQILPNLYLGGVQAVKDPAKLLECGIRAVCVCMRYTEFPENELCPDIEYYRIDVEDVSREPIEAFWPEATEFIHSMLTRESPVLVHCRAGVSRSASTVIAYLISHHGYTLRDAFFLTRKNRQVATPNIGFMEKLIEWEEEKSGKPHPTVCLDKYVSWYSSTEMAAVPDLSPD